MHKTLYFFVQTAFSHANWAVKALANCTVRKIQCFLQAQVGSDLGTATGNVGAGADSQ